MSTQPQPKPAANSSIGLIGFALCRVIVPLWVLTGAIFKLREATPKTLPETVRDIGMAQLGIHAFHLLAALIAIEFVLVGIMMFVGKLARVTAIFILTIFCAILISEMVKGNTSCGCLGPASPAPWVMLIIDGALLLGVIAFRPMRGGLRSPQPVSGIFAAVAVAALGAAISFGRLLPMSGASMQDALALEPSPTPSNGDRATSDDALQMESPPPAAGVNPDGTINNPNPTGKPGYYYAKDIDKWVGRKWQDIDLIRLMPTVPAGLDTGKRHLIFYSRTCDHCQEMFTKSLSRPLTTPVTAIEIPVSKDSLRGEGAWPMPQTEAQLLELPLGIDWILTPPLIITIEDGVVTCANEGDYEACFD